VPAVIDEIIPEQQLVITTSHL